MPLGDNGIIKNAPNPSNISGQLTQMAAHYYSILYWGELTNEEVKNPRILKITGYLEQASRLLYIYGGNASCLVVSF